MWLVQDADTRIYILGTMHALPPRTEWATGPVADAIAAADELVMELSPAEVEKAGDEFKQLARRSAPLAIADRLSGQPLAGYRALEDRGARWDGDKLDDWALVILMGQHAARKAELSTADGVETGLTRKFKASGKPVAGLETAQGQLMLFETLDDATQRALLVRAAAGADKAPAEVANMTAAWRRGDVAALERIVNEDVDAVPAARKALIADRNRRWSAWAARRMDRPGTVLMAVGAGHMVGDDGVPALLAAKGFEVRRVQ